MWLALTDATPANVRHRGIVEVSSRHGQPLFDTLHNRHIDDSICPKSISDGAQSDMVFTQISVNAFLIHTAFARLYRRSEQLACL